MRRSMRRWIQRIKGYRAFFKRYGFLTGLVVITILPQVREEQMAAHERLMKHREEHERLRRYESNSIQNSE